MTSARAIPTELSQALSPVGQIDQSFIADLPDSKDAMSLTRTIAMAQSLNIRTIAEGVEQKGQLAF
jgi:EAL domain-containing protein (putative c-di-GMP-specific phosphodiesterase class I)